MTNSKKFKPRIEDVCGESDEEGSVTIIGGDSDSEMTEAFFPDPGMNNAFLHSLSGTDHDVAQFAKYLVFGEFASVDTKNTDSSWYQFRNGGWFNSHAAANLFERIDTLPGINKDALEKTSRYKPTRKKTEA